MVKDNRVTADQSGSITNVIKMIWITRRLITANLSPVIRHVRVLILEVLGWVAMVIDVCEQAVWITHILITAALISEICHAPVVMSELRGKVAVVIDIGGPAVRRRGRLDGGDP